MVQFEGRGLGLGLPRCFQELQGEGVSPGVAGCCRLGSARQPCPGSWQRGLHHCPPSKSFACGSSNARPHQRSLEQLLKDPGRKIIPLCAPMAATPAAGGESWGQSWCPAWQDPRPGDGTSAARQG